MSSDYPKEQGGIVTSGEKWPSPKRVAAKWGYTCHMCISLDRDEPGTGVWDYNGHPWCDEHIVNARPSDEVVKAIHDKAFELGIGEGMTRILDELQDTVFPAMRSEGARAERKKFLTLIRESARHNLYWSKHGENPDANRSVVNEMNFILSIVGEPEVGDDDV